MTSAFRTAVRSQAGLVGVPEHDIDSAASGSAAMLRGQEEPILLLSVEQRGAPCVLTNRQKSFSSRVQIQSGNSVCPTVPG